MYRELDVRDLVTRYQNGDSIARIASDLAVSASTIRRRLVDERALLRPAGTTRPRPDRSVLDGHLAAGMTRAEIADAYGVIPSAVSNWITRYGLREPPRARPTAAELCELYIAQKLSLTAIANRYGVTKQAVWQWLVNAGLPRRSTSRTRSSAAEVQIEHLYLNQRLTSNQIGRKLGISRSTVERALERRHIPRRGPQPALTNAEIAAEVAEGTPVAAIALKYSCSHSSVYSALRRAGLQTNQQALRQQRSARTHKFGLALDALLPTTRHDSAPPNRNRTNSLEKS